tara:strand:+ start:180 stop:566 length:387 start_codon:yes stop_codon:yes gene_type:complete
MRNDKTMPNDWVSSPLTKWLVNNNVTLHKLTQATNLSPNVVYNVVRGQTLQPRDKTIQKLCSFTGLSRRQFGFHTRAVREMRKSVDKSVVSRGTVQRIKATKPVDDTFTFTITVKASDLPKSITGFLR